MAENVLAEIYSDPSSPGSFGGVERLYREAKTKDPTMTRDRVKKYLASVDAYTLLRDRKTRFPTRKARADGPGQCFHGDLMDVSSTAATNDGTRFISIAIDVYSRYLFASPQKDKSSESTASSLHRIFRQVGACGVFFCDGGKEYLGCVDDLFEAFGVRRKVAQNSVKSFLAEVRVL